MHQHIRKAIVVLILAMGTLLFLGSKAMADFLVTPSWNVDGTGKADGSVSFTIDGQLQTITNGSPVTIPGSASEASVAVHADYRINKITIDGADTTLTSTTDYTYAVALATLTPNTTHTFAVVFDHQIKVTANGSGCITSDGSSVACSTSSNNVIVANGATKTFGFSANSGSCVTDVTVDGSSLGAFASGNGNYNGTTYSFDSISASHTLAATFGSATITVLVGANDDATGTTDDAYIQAHSPGWRAYKTDATGNKTGSAFKSGVHGGTISIPADTSSCDTRYIVIEFLNLDGWQAPSSITVDLQGNFTDQQITGLYDANSHVLTTTATNGSITRDPVGDAWVTDNQRVYPQGTTVTVKAVANSGWFFQRWNGDIGSAVATSAAIELTMNQDRNVTAVFVQPCQDADGDGYTVAAYGTDCVATTEIDCDDTNANIHPGATEICGDGIDQNCNGSADDVCSAADTDSDGDGYTPNQGDCNDTNANIAPGKYDDPATAANEDCYDGAKQAGTELVCVSASDVPANAAMKPAPPMIMFLLDDSGSMDWEVMTSEGDQRFNGDGYIYSYDEIEKTYASTTYPALSTSERGLWKSQWFGYNRMFFNPSSTYTPWPMWEKFAENIRTHEIAYTPSASGATFPNTAYAAGYTHADMDRPRLNSRDSNTSGLSAMYHPGDSSSSHATYELDLNATYLTIYSGGQHVTVSRDSSSSGSSTYADAIGLSTKSTLQLSVGYPVSSFSTTAVPYKPEIIFDNSDSTVYSESGTWYNTTNNAIYAWNSDGRYTASTSTSASWSLNLSSAQAGKYYVYAWVNEDSARDNNALYTIYYYTSGTLVSTTYRRDQSPDSGWGKTPRYGAKWLLLNSSPIAFEAQEATTTVAIPNAHYYVLVDSNDNGTKDTGESLYLVTIPGSGYQVGNYSLHYYLVNDIDGDNSVENGELIEKFTSKGEVPTSVIPVRYDAFGNKITDEYQLAYMVRQDFADWVSFYRKRILTAKAAVGLTVEDMKGVELGIHTINHSLSKPLVLMSTADGTEKQTFLQNLYTIRASGGTPLRQGLYEVGKYFQKGADSDTIPSTTDGLGTKHNSTCTSSDDSVFWDGQTSDDADNCDDSGGECQRAYVVAMTDGYYNETFKTIANIDGNSTYNTDAVFQDSTSYTLADVAMYFYKTDLDPSLADLVPTKGYDNNPKQHMVTYTVAFGVSGQYDPDLFPKCLPKCDTPGTTGCPAISALSNLSASSYSSTGGPYENVCPTWPSFNPNDGTETPNRIDDLWHAAVNSRGSFLSAANPAELVTAMKTIKDLIEVQTGTASSVSINANKITENTLIYQSIYDTSDWSGDVVAKCLDSTGAIASCTKTSCQATCSTNYSTCVTACGGNTSCEESCATTQKSCTSSCTGSTCEETYETCTASCTTSSCQTACSNAKTTCSLNAPEVKWSASKNLSAITATNRQIITADNSGNGLAFRWAKINAAMQTQLQGDQYLLNYLRGDSTYERQNDTSGFKNYRNRSSKLGDFINSEPYHYANTTLGIDWVIIGGNDGMLHIFDGTNGKEIFAFIPNTVLSNLYLLSQESYTNTHKFFVDGYLTIKNLGTKVVLVGGLGKGGKGYFALDLTAAATYKTDIENHASEIVLWEYSDTSLSAYVTSEAHNHLGYSFSRPQIIASNDSSAKWFVAFGNGYESTKGEAVLFTLGLNSSTGKIVWSKLIFTGMGGTSTCANPSTNCTLDYTCNGLSTPAFIFPQGDGTNDYAYAGDLQGNLWKFDLNSTSKDSWSVYFEDGTGKKQPLFQAKSSAGWRQPITMQPVIISACPTDQKGYQILFGTGRILDPSSDFLDLSVQTVYGIWDWSAAWKAAGVTYPERKYLGSFNGTSSATSTCKTSCASTLGSKTSSGSCLYNCAGDSDCESDCTDSYTACTTNCSALRTLSNMSTIVGTTSSPYVTLLRQTQVWAGGINYNSDGTVAKTVYGATDLDTYDVISRVLSNNTIDWYIPADAATFAASTKKTAKHVGWYFDLPANGERIVRGMTVANGKLIFTSTIPSSSPCKSGGTSYNWAANACTGGRLDSALFDANNDGVVDSNDYINIGTAANPIYVSLSSIGAKGITPAVTVADVVNSEYERLYTPEQDQLNSIIGDVKGTPINYWREMKWQP